MLRIILAASLLACSTLAPAQADLKRRADWGAAIAMPDGDNPARIVRMRDNSVLEKAGLKAGDLIVEANGRAVTDGASFGAQLRALRAGDRLRLQVRRGAQAIAAEAVAPPMKLETIAGVEVRYAAAQSDKGYRVRTYVSRPAGARGKLPVVVFVPWLSCGTVENPFGANDGVGKLLEAVMRDSGAQVVRVEKPGLGDSEGPDCSASDLDHDMSAFRAGIRAALDDPGADAARLYLMGGSIGGALVAVLAREFPVRGVVSLGGFARTWYEHMLDIERRRLTLSGTRPAQVNAAMKGFAHFYDLTLRQGLAPAEAIARHPELGRLWYDAPAHQYGRPMRYYQQVQALDVEGAWAEVAVPTLIAWGEYDWIMGREESERAAAIVRARDPALLTYLVRPGMDHHFDVYPDAHKAFAEEGGRYDEGVGRAVVEWLRAQTRS